MSEEVRGFGGRGAGLAAAHDLRFRGHAVAERQVNACLHQPSGAILRVLLQCVEQFHTRGAHVAKVERGNAALKGRARPAGAGREQRQRQHHWSVGKTPQ